MLETWIQSLGQEDPLEKEMATHSSILAWRLPWTVDPGRLWSMGSQRVRFDWATNTSILPLRTCGSTIPASNCNCCTKKKTIVPLRTFKCSFKVIIELVGSLHMISKNKKYNQEINLFLPNFLPGKLTEILETGNHIHNMQRSFMCVDNGNSWNLLIICYLLGTIKGFKCMNSFNRNNSKMEGLLSPPPPFTDDNWKTERLDILPKVAPS